MSGFSRQRQQSSSGWGGKRGQQDNKNAMNSGTYTDSDHEESDYDEQQQEEQELKMADELGKKMKLEPDNNSKGVELEHSQPVSKMKAKASVDLTHPLSPRWEFWLWVGDRLKDWADCLRRQCLITSVEDFIALKHRILPPSRLPNDPFNPMSYWIFKEGIKPMWEDPCNRQGGAIGVCVQRQLQYTRLDSIWFELLMAALGAQFGERNDQICGVTFRATKNSFVISVWIRNASDFGIYGPIVDTVSKLVGAGNNIRITITQHPTQNNDKTDNEKNGWDAA